MRLALEARGAVALDGLARRPVIAAALTIVARIHPFLRRSAGEPGRGVLRILSSIRFSDLNGVRHEMLLRASPLMLIGTVSACGYRANAWRNIGAEGQLVPAARSSPEASRCTSTACGRNCRLVLPAMLVAGALGGMLWAAIPAFLRTRFNTNENPGEPDARLRREPVRCRGSVHEPWRDPEGFNFPPVEAVHRFGAYPMLVEGTRLQLPGFVVARSSESRFGYVFLNRRAS